MATATRVKLNYGDLRLFPNDWNRHELIDGEHIMSPTPKTKHQQASINLAALLHAFVRQHNAGRVLAAPFDVVFSDFDVTEPDTFCSSPTRARTFLPKTTRAARPT